MRSDGSSAPTIVLGNGVAGAAIAYRLHSGRFPVRLVGSNVLGSSHKNQKWLHSGALYPSQRIARNVWDEFRNTQPRLQQHVVSQPDSATFLAIHPETIERRSDKFKDLLPSGFGWQELGPSEYSTIGALGRTNANAGRRAKDQVIDFPAVIDELARLLPSDSVLANTLASTIETGGSPRRVVAVQCRTSNGVQRLECSRCVLAAGAWTPLLLAQSDIVLTEPIIRKKCVVITFSGELVPGITVCYDIKHFDPLKQEFVPADVSLVPYRGQTLGAGVGWSRLESTVDPEAIVPTDAEVQELMFELCQAFPGLSRLRGRSHSCIKTELETSDGVPNVRPQVFDHQAHGVEGLYVTLPGKASLMFDLADKVLAALRGDEAS